MELDRYVHGVSRGIRQDDKDMIKEQADLVTEKVTELDYPVLYTIWKTAYIVSPTRWDLYFAPFEQFGRELQTEPPESSLECLGRSNRRTFRLLLTSSDGFLKPYLW